MSISGRLRKISLLAIVCAISLAASPLPSQAKENGKAKGKQKVETKGKHGREADELPFGLQQHSEKKGELPSGLQKKKAEDGSLTQGLEQGGRGLKSSAQGKKGQK